MNEGKKIHQTPAALKQHAWKTPLSIASLALITVVSVSSVNIDAIAEEPAVDANRTSPIDYTVNTFVKITDALIAGKITPEEAAQKIHTTNRVNTYLTKVETDISVAVESGKMTVDEGMEKYDAAVKNINKRMGGEKGKNNERAQAYLTKVGTEIREAVASGEMTPEEGKAKYATAEERIKKRMGGGNSKSMTKEEYEQGVAKMVEMVKTGEITREQMEARLNRMKKAMGGEKGKSNDRVQIYLTKVGTEIREAVANGEMTAEEGKVKYLATVEKVKLRMAKANSGEGRDSMEGFRRRIGAAVADGKMTREEAREAYEEYRSKIKDRNTDGGEGRRGKNRDKGSRRNK